MSSDSSGIYRYTVDGVGRLYTTDGEQWLPSVSTVLDVRPTPPALKRWKENTENAEEITRYKQNRGTLIHEALQQDLIPDNPRTGKPVKVLWGDDEQESEDELKANGEWDRFEEEREWALDTWDTIKKVANFDAVIDAETFVTNTDIGYAGQFDLLYQDHHENETVLADIKTSKDVYDKHMLQSAAYAHAVPISIDRMEIIRINPDHKDWYISRSDQWTESRDELFNEFCRLRSQLADEKLNTILEIIEDGTADQEGILREEM